MLVNKKRIIKLSIIILLSAILIVFISIVAIAWSEIGWRSKLDNRILSRSADRNYLITVEFDKVKKNGKSSGVNYFGNMYFANLSDRYIGPTILGDGVSTIYIKNGDDIYPLYYDSIASVFWSVPKKQIGVSPVVVWGIPKDFDWSKAKTVVNERIFDKD